MSTTKTISTAEEVIYTPEDTLPAVPAAQVKQLRALNTNGESVNVTPDELAKTNVRPTRNYSNIITTLVDSTFPGRALVLNISDPITHAFLNEGDSIFVSFYLNAPAGFSYKIELHTVTGGMFRAVTGVNSTAWSYSYKNEKFSLTQSDITKIKDNGGLIAKITTSSASDYTVYYALIGIGNQSVDWFPAVGIDYSLLTEQVVPGEFWLNQSGDARQVFTRSVSGTTGDSFLSGGQYYISVAIPELSNVEVAEFVYLSIRSVYPSGGTYNTGSSKSAYLQSASNFTISLLLGPFSDKTDADAYARQQFVFATKYIKI